MSIVFVLVLGYLSVYRTRLVLLSRSLENIGLGAWPTSTYLLRKPWKPCWHICVGKFTHNGSSRIPPTSFDFSWSRNSMLPYTYLELLNFCFFFSQTQGHEHLWFSFPTFLSLSVYQDNSTSFIQPLFDCQLANLPTSNKQTAIYV